MSNKVPMTTAGVAKLRAELHELKTVARPQIIAAIAEARAHGDLKENAEYHAAREQQSFSEGRIAEIESKLANAQIIDVREHDEYVAGHLPESRHIPAGRLEERAGELDKLKDTPLILICQTGARSTGACKQLAKLGFSKVHNLEGGINAWRAAGLPLKKGTKK